ncbi:hypothetical protein KCU82_g2, partial [Aureobasidium melanogenum]
MKFDFSVLAAATALIGSATAAPQNSNNGNNWQSYASQASSYWQSANPSATAPAPLPRNALSLGPAASVPEVTAVLVDGEAATDTVLSVTSATAQTLAGVLGAPVLGLPDPGPLGGVEATVPTAPGLAGLLALGAQTHLGLRGRAARLPRLPRRLSLLLSLAHPPLLLPMAFA